MANDINIPQVGGSQAPLAFNQADPSRTFGNQVIAPMQAPTIAKGAFGDFSGDMAMGQALGSIGKDLFDVSVREQALKTAGEHAQKQLQQAEWQTAELRARQSVADAKKVGTVGPDAEAKLYQQNLEAYGGEVNKKYNYTTPVGNTIDKEYEVFKDANVAHYNATTVEKSRVDDYLTKVLQVTETQKANLINKMSLQGNAFNFVDIKSEVDKILEPTFTPEYIAAIGGSAVAFQQRSKLASELYRDLIAKYAGINPESAKALLEYSGDDDPLQAMDPSLRQQMHHQVTYDVKTLHAERAAALKENQDKNEYEMTKGVFNGQVGVADIDKAYRGGLIDQGHAERLVIKLMNKKKADADAAERRALITDQKKQQQYNDSLSGKPAAVDKRFQNEVLPQLAKMPPEQRDSTVLGYIRETGAIPTFIGNDIKKRSFDPDPKVAAAAINIARQIQQTAPWAFAKLPDDVKKLTALSERHSVEQAQATLSTLNKMGPEEVKTLTTNGHKWLQANPKALDKALDDSWIPYNDAKIDDATRSEYKQLFMDNLVGRDYETASKLAADEIKSKWGVTNIGPKRYVRNGPEIVYADQHKGNVDMVYNQLEKDMGEKGIKDYRLLYKGPNSKGTPEYFVTDPTGIRIRDENGQPLRWHFDRTTAQEHLDAVTKQKMEKQDATLKAQIQPITSRTPNGMRINTTTTLGIK